MITAMTLMTLILAVAGLTIASWTVVALVENLRHDAPVRGRLPRSHEPDAFDPDAQRWRQAS